MTKIEKPMSDADYDCRFRDEAQKEINHLKGRIPKEYEETLERNLFDSGVNLKTRKEEFGNRITSLRNLFDMKEGTIFHSYTGRRLVCRRKCRAFVWNLAWTWE